MTRTKKANKRGQGMTEYIVILGVIVALLLLFRTVFQPQVSTAVNSLSSQINSAIQP